MTAMKKRWRNNFEEMESMSRVLRDARKYEEMRERQNAGEARPEFICLPGSAG